MPEPAGRGSREFLPSANQALSELEQATGNPVLIVEAPELKVLATIRRAGPEDSSHVLRIKGGENRSADYLIVFECRMALWDGQGHRVLLRSNPEVRGQVISECVELHSHLPLAQALAQALAKAQELGSFIYDCLILQLRSMGPGLLVDRWIREHCPGLHEAQERAITSAITNNLGALKPSTRANYPVTIYEASIAMNAAYARFGDDLLGKPYLAVPYLSQGYGEVARRLITLALGDGDPAQGPADRQIIDSWAGVLGISSWCGWSEPVEANALTAAIKQLKEGGQVDQLGERRGARNLLSEQGRAAVASQAMEDD
jgi:hypothetical protein